MVITVKFIGAFREAAGTGEIRLNNVRNVKELFDLLIKKFDAKLKNEMFDSTNSKLLDWVFLSLNGRNVKLPEEIQTSLSDGDVVVIYPPLVGG